MSWTPHTVGLKASAIVRYNARGAFPGGEDVAACLGRSQVIRFPASDQLTVRDLQAFHRDLDQAKGFDLDLFRNLTYLMAELGEAVRAARQLERAEGLSEEDVARDHLGEELADCLAYILKLANYAGIDLQKCYAGKMKQNLKRTWPKKRASTLYTNHTKGHE